MQVKKGSKWGTVSREDLVLLGGTSWRSPIMAEVRELHCGINKAKVDWSHWKWRERERERGTKMACVLMKQSQGRSIILKMEWERERERQTPMACDLLKQTVRIYYYFLNVLANSEPESLSWRVKFPYPNVNH